MCLSLSVVIVNARFSCRALVSINPALCMRLRGTGVSIRDCACIFTCAQLHCSTSAERLVCEEVAGWLSCPQQALVSVSACCVRRRLHVCVRRCSLLIFFPGAAYRLISRGQPAPFLGFVTGAVPAADGPRNSATLYALLARAHVRDCRRALYRPLMYALSLILRQPNPAVALTTFFSLGASPPCYERLPTRRPRYAPNT